MRDKPSDPDIERQLERWAASQPDEGLSEELHRKVRDVVTQSLTPVKPIPGLSVLVLRFLGVFAVCAAGLIAIVGKTGLHLMTWAQIGWMGLILAVGAILFALALAWQMVPGRRRGLSLPWVLALSGLGLIAGIALNFRWQIPGAFAAEGWPCGLMELTMGLPAIGLFWLVARRGALFGSAALGAALAGLAAFLALTPLQVQCMFPQAPHLLVWHGGTVTLLIGVGALIGYTRRHRPVS